MGRQCHLEGVLGPGESSSGEAFVVSQRSEELGNLFVGTAYSGRFGRSSSSYGVSFVRMVVLRVGIASSP